MGSTEEREWDENASNVALVLDGLDMSKYTQLFDEQGIDFEIFLTLTEEDLEAVGVENEADRSTIRNTIRNLKKSNKLETAVLDIALSEEEVMTICKNTLKQLTLLHAALAHTRLRLKKDDVQNILIRGKSAASILHILDEEARTVSLPNATPLEEELVGRYLQYPQ